MAYAISRLITIEPGIQLEPEPEGNEFGYYIFDCLSDNNTVPKEETVVNMINNAIPM